MKTIPELTGQLDFGDTGNRTALLARRIEQGLSVRLKRE
jgi:hypothetical protein